MVSLAAKSDPRPAWFVGAAFGGNDDQSARFLYEGIWENGYTDRYLEQVKSIQPGDRIAIKSTYTRKNGLPFDSRGNDVSVMAIKAIGTVTENLNNGRHLKVDWTAFDSPREWYFPLIGVPFRECIRVNGLPTVSSLSPSAAAHKISTSSETTLIGRSGLGMIPCPMGVSAGPSFTPNSPISYCPTAMSETS